MGPDRLRESLLQIIHNATRRVDYLRAVRARVVHVLSGGAVDTEPETAGTPQQAALPARYGIPGVLRATARAGARVLVAWADGDPAQPYVAAWDGGEQLDELVFNTTDGHEHLARTGDAAACGTLSVTAAPATSGPPASVITLTYTPPDDGATPQVITLAGPAGITGTGAVTLSGIVTGTSRIQG